MQGGVIDNIKIYVVMLNVINGLNAPSCALWCLLGLFESIPRKSPGLEDFRGTHKS